MFFKDTNTYLQEGFPAPLVRVISANEGLPKGDALFFKMPIVYGEIR